MPVAGGPKITKTGILLDVDAANASSYTSGSSTWVNVFNPGTRNGTINGSVGFDADDSKGALTFPGTASSYADFGNIGDLSVSWSFQVAVKPAPSASGNYTILSYASGSDTGSWTYKLDYSSSNQSAVLSVYSATGSTQVVHQVTGSVPTGSWSIINASYGNTVIGMYVNGQPTGYTVTTGSTAGYNSGNRLYLGGTYGLDSGFYTGSMASFFSYNTDVPNTQLVQNYNAYGTRFGLKPSILFPTSVDPDAFRFIEIANITDVAQAAAVSNLVTGLKGYGLWDKMVAIYPFVGGSAYSHKYNLKNPASNIISWNGSVDHTSNGVRFTSGGYGSLTGLSPQSFDQDSVSVSTYAVENGGASGTYAYFGGGTSRLNPNFEVFILTGNPYIQFNMSNVGGLNNNAFENLGFLTFQRPNSAQLNGYYNGSLVQTVSKASTGRSSGTLAVGRVGSYFGTVTMADAYLGEALTDTEAANLYTLVLAYQTALGRNV